MLVTGSLVVDKSGMVGFEAHAGRALPLSAQGAFGGRH